MGCVGFGLGLFRVSIVRYQLLSNQTEFSLNGLRWVWLRQTSSCGKRDLFMWQKRPSLVLMGCVGFGLGLFRAALGLTSLVLLGAVGLVLD